MNFEYPISGFTPVGMTNHRYQIVLPARNVRFLIRGWYFLKKACNCKRKSHRSKRYDTATLFHSLISPRLWFQDQIWLSFVSYHYKFLFNISLGLVTYMYMNELCLNWCRFEWFATYLAVHHSPKQCWFIGIWVLEVKPKLSSLCSGINMLATRNFQWDTYTYGPLIRRAPIHVFGASSWYFRRFALYIALCRRIDSWYDN